MQISENESLNQTATRLLKGILGQSKAGLTLSGGDEIQQIVKEQVIALTPSTSPEDEDIKQILRQELIDAIAQIKGLIDERLGKVALPTQEAVCVEQQVIPDYEAIRSSILSKFKVGKQSAAKAIDAFIEELDAVTAKQQLETEELDVAS
jgi:hypothetical protein